MKKVEVSDIVLGIAYRCQSDFSRSETSKPGNAGLGGIVLKRL
jgi:hypothetical protein